MAPSAGPSARRSTTASAERLLNLLIALLDRESGYTREQLRGIVPGEGVIAAEDELRTVSLH